MLLKQIVIYIGGIKLKRVIENLLYLFGLLLLIYFGSIYNEQVRMIASRDFNIVPLFLFNSVYSIIVGMYIAVPKLVNSLKEPGRVQVDWLKILIIGIPTFLISISGVLYHQVESPVMIALVQWISIKFNMATALIGVVCGYILLSSISKEKNTETISLRNNRIAKIITLVLLASFLSYIAIVNINHPIKLVKVNAEIVETNTSGYQVGEGAETTYLIQTEIQYTFEFENIPKNRLIADAFNDNKIRIEPKKKLGNLLPVDIFYKPNSFGYGTNGKKVEIRFAYTIGSIDPGGNHPDKYPPSLEELDKIKDSLYDAVLIFELKNNEKKQYELIDYKND